MISRTTTSLKKLKGKHITVETKKYRIVKVKKLKKLPKGTLFLIPSADNPGGSKMGRKRKPGRPKGSKTKKKRKRRSSASGRPARRRLPPRIKTGKRKGQFRKRKK